MNKLTESKKVAIQGFEGSFHQTATRQFFGKNVEVACCATFRELIKKAEDRTQTDAAVMAIENSIAGSILANYNLLQRSSLTITGEIYLQIKQNLLVNPGVSLEDIREVHSHPMALQQCLEFLDKYNWKLVETEDTALSAKHIHQHKSKHVAAIAGKLAAELFDLEMIAPNIHTLKNNYTRFLVLQREKEALEVEGANKASVNFSTDHTKGSLVKVLGKIAEADINLSKLQSFPIPGSNFNYSFHADMEFDDKDQFYKLVEKIKPVTNTFKIYGLYKNGNK
ncbi:prephenate dehydratase [Ferruginibacter sp. HRS2-29]|uniref:prephenate dehydratase n=1 Tax=Ferruginibacter sp. HRS2-29 TaxID=2487334 RepID=UPI0020CB9018|nr:prephenate dehydratase [Ferruginibacter sp. HRS2-29]MCP9751425.1 chorismate mutase [Ferruginibacter sp. HRS2-29]